MPSESCSSSELRGAKANHHQVFSPPAPSEPEKLPCPRCDSTNTKFCYYNNYNFSQPRHFCKSCRRYWTHGGTLRDIPVGGGSRRNAKRSRIITVSSATSTYEYRPTPATTSSSLLAPLAVAHGGSVPFGSDAKSGMNECGSFTSLLNTQGHGLFTLGGFGLGLGLGAAVEDVGFGLGRAVWPFPGLGLGDGGAIDAGGPSVLGNTWQLQSGEAGLVGVDRFTLSDVAISTTGHGLK